MKAGGTINISSGGRMDLKSGENINADALQIHLNDNLAAAADPDIGQTDSYYGNTGVTTY